MSERRRPATRRASGCCSKRSPGTASSPVTIPGRIARRKDREMTGLIRTFRRRAAARSRRGAPRAGPPPPAAGDEAAPIDIAPNDPLLAYFQSASGAVDIEALELDSPALAELKAAGVKLAVPLVSQGELIGVLNLGPRLSEQDYSSDDRKLLDKLAAQAAPALRVGQLVREQQAEAATRQRIEQELEVATADPAELPAARAPRAARLAGRRLLPPGARGRRRLLRLHPAARGQIGFVVGDVTDKGVPAALVMAATRSVLRASAQRLARPGRRARARQRAPVPRHAGEDVRHLPVRRARPGDRPLPLRQRRSRPAVRQDGRRRRRSCARRGMPLGLMPGMPYEEKEAVLEPGRSAAPALRRRRRGARPRARDVRLPAPQAGRRRCAGGGELIDRVLLRPRRASPARPRAGGRHHAWSRSSARPARRLAATAPSPDGSARRVRIVEQRRATSATAIARGSRGGRGARPRAGRLERLKTAVAEATMNAMEHGNE